MVDLKWRSWTVTQKAFKMLGLIGLGREDRKFSSPSVAFPVIPYKPANALPSCSLKEELKKAQALMYFRMLDRPK